MNKLFWGAAIAGGLYWASRQPGGIKGTFNRFSGRLKQIQDSPDPLGTLKNQFSDPQIEQASPYTPMPDHQPIG